MNGLFELPIPEAVEPDNWNRMKAPDDDHLALQLGDAWNGEVAYFHHKWHRYAGGVWSVCPEHIINWHIRAYLRGHRSNGVRVTTNLITGISKMMRDDRFISDGDITESQSYATQYINLQNGMYNLRTHKLEAHNPDLMFTSQLDFEYDPDATCPQFEQFLKSSLVYPDSDETDLDLVALVLQALAYSMTSRTDLKASFWLLGKPDSGKSTLIAFLRSLMGSLHATIDLNQLGTNRFLLSGIVGKRVVTFTEANNSAMLPDALYKAMVGGEDEIYVDVKNRDGISFKPTAKFWWAMNDAPRINDRTGATFNRLKIIPFNRSIPRHQRIGNLIQLLEREKAGVFNVLMHQYIVLCERGWRQVAQSEQLIDQYRLENDTEQTFINEVAQLHESYRCSSTLLYQRYRAWCEDRGFKPRNMNQLAGEWRRLGFESIKSDGRMMWKGLKIPEKPLT